MRNPSPTIAKVALLFSDFFSFVVGFAVGLIGLWFYGDYQSQEQLNTWWMTVGRAHSWAYLTFVLFALFRFYSIGAYSDRRPFWDELRIFLGILFTVAALNGVVVLIAKWPFARVVWLTSWTTALIIIPFLRSLTKRLLSRLGLWKRRTLIIGGSETAASAYFALTSEPGLGLDVVQIYAFQKSEFPAEKARQLVKVIPQSHLVQEIKKYPQSQIVIALEEAEYNENRNAVEELTLHFPEVQFVPPLSGLPLFQADPFHFFSHEVLVLKSRNNLHFRPKIWLKRSFDIVASLTAILILSPVLIFIAAWVRTSGPKVLFKHKRVGQKGRQFSCYKFRSMALNADRLLQELLEKDPAARKEWQEKMKITNDPRVTKSGHFLRKTSLDELPQLWNVLRGDMSLVGPRPIVNSEKERYGNRIDFYTSVKPGITGLWQVSGRSDTDYKTRVQLDTWYVKNWTLWYDIAILFKTIKVVINRSGAY